MICVLCSFITETKFVSVSSLLVFKIVTCAKLLLGLGGEEALDLGLGRADGRVSISFQPDGLKKRGAHPLWRCGQDVADLPSRLPLVVAHEK